MNSGYGVSHYSRMITDSVRMNAYIQALQKAIKPGSVVLDLGAGTGIFALLACRMGARRVYAIESNEAILVGQKTAIANGYADRITFIHSSSFDITLPEPVDVIISDLRGVLPFFRHHIPAIIDARSRFLRPAGNLIPQRDTPVGRYCRCARLVS